jgi:hypothetical protein
MSFLKAAYFKIEGNHQIQCWFCGIQFSSWNDQISHLKYRFKNGYALIEWQDPWIGPPVLSNCSASYSNGISDEESGDDDSTGGWGGGDDGPEDEGSINPANDVLSSSGPHNRSSWHAWTEPTGSPCSYNAGVQNFVCQGVVASTVHIADFPIQNRLTNPAQKKDSVWSI